MDYPVNEQLTRTLALDRLKKLSDLYVFAKQHNDQETMKRLAYERLSIKHHYMKVVK